MPCSVVIPCHFGADLTRACVQSLLPQQTAGLGEILLVDNAGDPDTRALADLSDLVRVLPQPRNLGFAGGVNRGIAAARCDDVLVLNNDTRAGDNLIGELTRVLHSDPHIGAAAPVSNHVKGDAFLPIGETGRDDDNRRQITAELQGSAFVQDVDSLAGLCLLVRRATFDEVGLFDERFGHGNYEDDDFSLRLRLRGYRLALARRAFLHHEGHATFKALGIDLPTEFRRRMRQFVDKWRDHAAGRAAIAWLCNDLPSAAKASEVARRHAPNWLDADWMLGRYHEDQGDARAAVRHLRAFLTHCPEHVEARLTLGLAQIRAGDSEAGRAMIAATLRAHAPSELQQIRLLLRLGQLDYEAGDVAAARRHFELATALPCKAGVAHNWLGLCLLADGELAEAATRFEQAIALGNALAHTNLGVCRHRQGQAEAALQSFEKAVTLLPHDPVARANYEAGVAACGAAARSSATSSSTI